METFEAGDLITFRLHSDDYGLAHILHVEHLTMHAHYHLAVLDAVLQGEEGGYDSYGVLNERSFTLGDDENAPVVIDHIALALEALVESSPSKVDFREVTEDDLAGYHLWLHSKREQLMQSGMIRDTRGDATEDEDYDDEYDDEEIEDGEDEDLDDDGTARDAGSAAGDIPESVEEEIDHLEREEGEESLYEELLPGNVQTVELRPWHGRVYERPLGDVLFELHDELTRQAAGPEAEGTGKLVGYISEFFEHKGEAIAEIITRFVEEGDYAAGHELVVFGDAAADALAQHLQDGMDVQTAEDILNILCDMGSLKSYEHIAAFFVQHGGNPGDPLGTAAARGFCYAVMLTGGTPPALNEQLDRLGDITDAELAHDVKAARDAVRNVKEITQSQAPPEASSDPFATLG